MPGYKVQKIPGILGNDLNDHGHVVGSKHGLTKGSWRPAIWIEGQVTEIPVPDTPSTCTHINNAGDVLCNAWSLEPPSLGWRDVSWSNYLFRNGELIELPKLAELDLNDHGVIAGHVLTGDPEYARSVIWSCGQEQEIPVDGFFARAINNRGDIVGLLVDPPGSPEDPVPAMWRSGKLTVISHPNTELVSAIDVNDSGDVLVLAVRTPPGMEEQIVPAIWSNDVLELIDLPSQGSCTFAHLSNRREVVGTDYLIVRNPPKSVPEAGFGWVAGQSLDLSELLGFPITGASAINNRGQILCHDDKNSYILTPE
ncbi:MAG: hypothetical protein QOJ65_1671 [Fimbriimonadaceae bacterium]|jgi:hypothetical protein|nr:hypothetical protein [Fimbriimonadaceae bacterium]